MKRDTAKWLVERFGGKRGMPPAKTAPLALAIISMNHVLSDIGGRGQMDYNTIVRQWDVIKAFANGGKLQWNLIDKWEDVIAGNDLGIAGMNAQYRCQPFIIGARVHRLWEDRAEEQVDNSFTGVIVAIKNGRAIVADDKGIDTFSFDIEKPKTEMHGFSNDYTEEWKAL